MPESMLDILMITCHRPEYTRRSLRALLDSCDQQMRVWVWHNGQHEETLDIVRGMQDHPNFHRLHHSRENRLVREPTNWLFSEADGDLLSVVADDCVVENGWAQTLRRAHADVPRLGVAACWHFALEDFDAELADRKTRTFLGNHRIIVNPWVQGSGVVLKRACVERNGLIPPNEPGFTSWCMRLAAKRWINGWYRPLIPIDHMDDPRSPHSMLKSDADLEQHLPLSARVRGVRSIDDWIDHLRVSAREVLAAPPQPWLYVGLGKKMRRAWMRLHRESMIFGRRAA